jgi:membrane-bound lytic murein transglycosylase D
MRIRILSLLGFVFLSFNAVMGEGNIVAVGETVGLNDTVAITTVSSVTQDTFSLSKHLKFFTSNYRHISQKHTPVETADSIYQQRLDSLGKGMAIPLVFNPKVKNYIKAYTDQKPLQMNVMLSLAQYYFPTFEEIFTKYGIPSELKYLAIIESALNPRAMSRVGASGLWQFMYQTGQMYNLKVNTFVDERFDPVKATEAAARYLRDLYRSFGDWTLVIAAYNCGPGNVNKAIRKAGGKTDFWKIYQFLPSETRNYVPAYIGATYAMNYHLEHGIPAPANEFPMLTDTVVVDRDIDFITMSEVLDMPLQTLRDLNPQYKQDIIPGGSQYYSMRLPVYVIPYYLEMLDTIAERFEEINREITLTYRVKQHETLSGIGLRFGVSAKDLMAWNNLKSTTIYPNQVLKVQTTQKAIEAIRSRPKSKQNDTVARETPSTTLLASTTTKPKPSSSRQQVASKAVSGASTTNVVGSATSNAVGTSGGASAATSNNSTVPAAQKSTTAQKTASTQATAQRTTTTPTQPRAQTQTTQRTTTAQNVQTSTQRTQTTQTQQQKPQPTRLPKGTVVSYKVKRGDTLYAILRRYPGSNIQETVRTNNLAKGGSLIQVGQIIKIKIN